MPDVGDLPDLPPKFIDGIAAANRGGPEQPVDAKNAEGELRTRLDSVELELTKQTEEGRQDDLRMERGSIHGALESLASEGSDDAESDAQASDPASEAIEADVQEHVAEAKEAIEAARSSMRQLPAVVREALFQQYFDCSPLVIHAWSSDSRFSVDEAREAEEDGFLVAEDDRPVYTPRTRKRQVREAEMAVRRARDVLCGESFGDSDEIADWLMPALEGEYEVDDSGFTVRSNWEAFGFL